jgi:hypothetical protein
MGWWIEEDALFTQIFYLTHKTTISKTQTDTLQKKTKHWTLLLERKGINLEFQKTHSILRYGKSIEEKGTMLSTEIFEQHHKDAVKKPLEKASQKYLPHSIISNYYMQTEQRKLELSKLLQTKKKNTKKICYEKVTDEEKQNIKNIYEKYYQNKVCTVTGKKQTLVLELNNNTSKKIHATNSFHGRKRNDGIKYKTENQQEEFGIALGIYELNGEPNVHYQKMTMSTPFNTNTRLLNILGKCFKLQTEQGIVKASSITDIVDFIPDGFLDNETKTIKPSGFYWINPLTNAWT